MTSDKLAVQTEKLVITIPCGMALLAASHTASMMCLDYKTTVEFTFNDRRWAVEYADLLAQVKAK
jgi:hypothetical protein